LHFTGQADARRRAAKRPFVLQVPDNKADAVLYERLPLSGNFDVILLSGSFSCPNDIEHCLWLPPPV
jgi:hypothetical protein